MKIRFKSHIFTFCKQKLWVNNPELLNLHKRLLVQSLIFDDYRPMFTICQDFYTLGVEVCFTMCGDFYLKGSEYGFNCWRTDKQTVNIDGLFYITLTVVVIPPHQLSLLSLPHHYLCIFQSWLGKFWVDWWGFS